MVMGKGFCRRVSETVKDSNFSALTRFHRSCSPSGYVHGLFGVGQHRHGKSLEIGQSITSRTRIFSGLEALAHLGSQRYWLFETGHFVTMTSHSRG